MSSIRKFLILLFLLSYVNKAEAQKWAPMGASWYYENQYMFSNINGYFDFRVTKDTVVQGKNCRVIESKYVWSCVYHPLPVITYESNDSVFILDYVDSTWEFQLQYRWNAQVGDTWTIKNFSIYWMDGYDTDTLEVYVDSVDFIYINGKKLRRQFVSYTYTPTFPGNRNRSGENIELIGSRIYFLHPQQEDGMCDYPFPTGLRCYSDNYLGTHMPIPSDSCNQIKDYTSIQEKSNTADITIFPNPFNREFILSTGHTDAGEVKIYNSNGQLVYEQLLPRGFTDHKITLPESAVNGIYLLDYSFNNQRITKRILLQK